MGFITDMFAPKNKFHADPADLDKSQYGGTIQQAQQGATDNSKFNQVFGQQQALNKQYADVAAGKGPNPAQQMLRQQTGQNVNMAQGQAASQRGVNPALAARLAVDTAAGANQQAVGQGATLQAQQSLAALGQQGALQGQMQQGANAQQAIQNQVLGTAGELQNRQNNAVIANTLGTNQINAGVAAQNTDLSGKVFGGLMNAAGGAMGLPMMAADGGIVPQAEAQGGIISPAQQPELAGLAQGGVVEEEVSPLHGYLASLESVAAPRQPPVQQFAGGGMAQPAEMPSFGTPTLSAPAYKPAIPDVQLPRPAWDSAPVEAPPATVNDPAKKPHLGGAPFNQGSSLDAYYRFANMGLPRVNFAEGGSVVRDPKQEGPPLTNRSEYYLDTKAENYAKDRQLYGGMNDSPWARQSFPGYEPRRGVDPALEARFREVQKHASGGPVPLPFVGGGSVPGQARVSGDSTKNDVVPALLSPGEAVIPRTVMQSPNPPAEAAAFIEHLLRRKGAGGSFDRAFKGRKMAEGGKVTGGAGGQEAAPSLTAAVTDWWNARGTPEQEQHGRRVDEAVNALLPSLVSGRKALLKKRADLKTMDDATKD